MAGAGLEGTLRIDFHQPPAPGTLFIHRTHPLVACLADHLLENPLDDEAVADGAAHIARAGAIFTVAVCTRTAVLLLRLRHQLTVTHRGHSRLLLCEETVTVAVAERQGDGLLAGDAVRSLLDAEPARNMPPPLRDHHLQQQLDRLPALQPALERLAHERAQTLLEDHRRVREAARGSGEYRVTPSLPVDVMGVFVLVPA